MTGYRAYAFALSAAFVTIWSAPPALAGPHDGNWRMLAVTTNGHCGKIKIGLGIRGSHIQSTSGSFVFRRINLVGKISASGHTKLNAVAGPRVAKGTGRFTPDPRQRDVVRDRALRCLFRLLERRAQIGTSASRLSRTRRS